MNGKASNNVTKIARIFGTKINVCSWICVSAWNSDTTTPTTRPTTIRGDDTITMVQIASRATSRVSGPVIAQSSIQVSSPPLDEDDTNLSSSLRAKRSNPDCHRGKILDCFATLAMTMDK